MSYQGPMLIREPELRWPIVLLAAIITVAIALAAAGMQYFALSQPYFDSHSQPRLEEGSLRAGNPNFEPLRDKVLVERLVGVEKMHPFNHLVVELTATVTNNTESTITGMELRGAIADSHGSLVRERTVVVVPARQTVLEPDEAMNVRILIENVDPDSERGHISLEVTALRFS